MSRSQIRTLLATAGFAFSILGLSTQVPHLAILSKGWFAVSLTWIGAAMVMLSVEFDSSRRRLLTNLSFWFGLPLIVGILLWSYVEYQSLQLATDPLRKGYAGVAITLVAGLSLFGMRTWYRITYGLTEIMVGVYLAWVKWTTTTGPLGELSKDSVFVTGLLTASIYLVVRGLDNVQTGWKARRASAATPDEAAGR